MASKHIGTLLAQRTAMLKENNPDLDVQGDIEEGDWGLITLKEGGELVGFEFIETESSWSRPDALLQYYEAANDGYYVGVIVPEEVLDDVTELIYSMGEDPITLLSYESIGLAPIIP